MLKYFVVAVSLLASSSAMAQQAPAASADPQALANEISLYQQLLSNANANLVHSAASGQAQIQAMQKTIDGLNKQIDELKVKKQSEN